jgi:hypothetical protein
MDDHLSAWQKRKFLGFCSFLATKTVAPQTGAKQNENIITCLHWEAQKLMGENLKSCLGRVFKFKLAYFVMCTIAWPTQAWPSLELKTWLRFCPVSLSLSMIACIQSLFSQHRMNETRKDNLLKKSYEL